VAQSVDTATSMWQRFMGLMGRGELPAGHGLFIHPCSSIHMFFMRFAIDAAFVDRDLRVVRVYHSLRPWRITRVVRRAKGVFELPAGTLAGAGVQTGDTLELVAAQEVSGTPA